MFVSKQLGRFLAVVCALILSAGSMLAQNLTVTGKVVDKSNEPIIGAYVVVVGTTTGTSTGVDGSYTIKAFKRHPPVHLHRLQDPGGHDCRSHQHPGHPGG